MTKISFVVEVTFKVIFQSIFHLTLFKMISKGKISFQKVPIIHILNFEHFKSILMEKNL